MAVQLNYVAPRGWKPKNPDENYVIVLFKIQLAEGVPRRKFLEAAASVAAESSTGTWTKVYAGKDSGMGRATRYRAIVFDIDKKRSMFKIAYPLDLFERDNMSGFLAGPAGNIAGMKMLSGLRIFDIRFPRKIIKSFPGPRFGISGLRKMIGSKGKMPVMGTVPKPKIGRSDMEQARLANQLFTAADGSYDFIKDDENLTNLSFNNFYKRAKMVLDVIKKVEKKNGGRHKKLYLCNVTHSSIDEMLKRASFIKSNGGRVMMMDVVVTGFAALHTMRMKNPGLFIHAHRAMHGFITRESGSGVNGRDNLDGFSVSMYVLAKIYRMLGVDSLHTGSPKTKMEDYGESEIIDEMITSDNTKENKKKNVLGQKWYGMKKVCPVASGGLHPGVLDKVVEKLGKGIIIQMGGGVLGHPDGINEGVRAAIEAREAVTRGLTIKEYVKKHKKSALAKAVELWGFEPKIVY